MDYQKLRLPSRNAAYKGDIPRCLCSRIWEQQHESSCFTCTPDILRLRSSCPFRCVSKTFKHRPPGKRRLFFEYTRRSLSISITTFRLDESEHHHCQLRVFGYHSLTSPPGPMNPGEFQASASTLNLRTISSSTSIPSPGPPSSFM